tara:strand:+ start:650 stop:1174 length:525 start_codon:yes stop_codon:yes gene_type:complete
MNSLKYYTHKLIIILFAVLISDNIYGQIESHDPIQKITLMSTICPGLGQAYNKKYWKIPVIYSALAGSIYYYIKNNNTYHEYRSAYIAETDSDPNTINNSGYSISNLITLQDYYRNRRDVSGLLFCLTYCLNIIDASVDAHLTNYNLNENLSLSLNINEIANTEVLNFCLKLNL